jgi:hypothetical protein
MTNGTMALLGAISGLLALTTTPIAGSQPVHIGPRPDRQVDGAKATFFVSVNGSDANDGRTRGTAFATLQKAADVVRAGETILVTSGVYRQSVQIRTEGRADAWIAFVGEPGAEIRGSEVRKDWKPVDGRPGVYASACPKLHSQYQRPGTDLKQRTEQVFVNGQLLRQVPDPAMLKPRNTFWVDDTAKLILVCLEGNRDPNEELTEVTTLTYAFAIAGPPNMNTIPNARIAAANKAAYLRIDGFTIRHIGNFSRMAAIQARGAWHHLIVENCDIQWVNYCGIALNGVHNFDRDTKEWFEFRAHNVTIRNNILSNCGVQGVGGGDVDDKLIEANVIDNNNYKGVSPWAEGGAVKTGFGGKRNVVRWNVARSNDNHGLWYDYADTEGVFENNFVYNAIAGAILNECSPDPGSERLPDGSRKGLEPTAEHARANRQRGTIIRNNILIGTRPPGGGGVNISNSTDTEVYNNITFNNAGGAINFGGSPTRPHTRGLHRNTVTRNISYRDFYGATALRDGDDKSARFFDNVAFDNLYVAWGAKTPFQISGVGAGEGEWKAFNNGRDNVYSDKELFRDPDRFDFTFSAEGELLAGQIGFDPAALRLNWSEYHIPEDRREVRRETTTFTPIVLSSVFNRALADETAGDGRGGWSDQGHNDMSMLAVGRQTLDGVVYLLGSQPSGAILLDTPHVKPGGFPDAVNLPVAGTFDELRFLYTCAWAPDSGQVARLIIRYQDGSTAEAPILAGRHILDWRIDPTWQQHQALNDNRVYAAWQGPNRSVGRVTIYHYGWPNPEPAKPIAGVTLTNRSLSDKPAFFLLGLTGVNVKRAATGPLSPRVFHIGFDGDIDALDAAGDFIDAQGYNQAAFDAGTFTEGIRDQGYIPGTPPIYYPVPANFATDGQGTISLWLKPADWRTPERQSLHRRAGYTRTMRPLSSEGGRSWSIAVEVSEQDYVSLRLSAGVSGLSVAADATQLFLPDQWIHILVRWLPNPERQGQTRVQLFADGRLVDTRDHPGAADQAPNQLYVGMPRNGGQPWRGVMDELSIWNKALTDAEIEGLLRAAGRDSRIASSCDRRRGGGPRMLSPDTGSCASVLRIKKPLSRTRAQSRVHRRHVGGGVRRLRL